MADDYNERLSELIEKTRKFKEIYIHKISKIKDYRQRTIALMLLGDIPIQYIAFVIDCTPRHIWRIIKRMSEE
jgi:hypothetical protein